MTTIIMTPRIDLDIIRGILESIRAEHGGLLDPHDVVAEGNDPQSMLYEMFEHDAVRGLYQYQLSQARALIRAVPIREVTQTVRIQSVSYYVKDPEATRTFPGYRPLEEIAQSPEAADALLAQEASRVAAYVASARAKVARVGRSAELESHLQQLLV
jgi:hypothetical protein